VKLFNFLKPKPKIDDIPIDVAAEANKAAKLEQERRKFCIERATYMDEARPENILAVAEKIYEYIYGTRET